MAMLNMVSVIMSLVMGFIKYTLTELKIRFKFDKQNMSCFIILKQSIHRYPAAGVIAK